MHFGRSGVVPGTRSRAIRYGAMVGTRSRAIRQCMSRNVLFRFSHAARPGDALKQMRNSRSQKLQEFRSCRMGRRLSGLGMVIHTVPYDKEFDSASSRFDRICSRP